MKLQGAKSLVVAAVDDLFFLVKIENAARRAGIELAQARDAAQLQECLETEIPKLVIVDLNCKNCTPCDSIRRIKSNPRLVGVPIIGFFSHVQIELERAAREAGCDQVLARSAFTSKLPDILARYCAGIVKGL